MKRLMLAAALALTAAPALAAEYKVKMLNKGGDGTRMAFEPSFIKATVGDTILFEPIDGGHATTSILVPPGGVPWEAPLNAQAEITVTAPGVYLFKSRPHYAVGMLGMILVDTDTPNREAIDNFKPRGSLMRKRFEALKGQL